MDDHYSELDQSHSLFNVTEGVVGPRQYITDEGTTLHGENVLTAVALNIRWDYF
jgi:hypothetical protein